MEDDGKVEVEVVVFDDSNRPEMAMGKYDFCIDNKNPDRYFISQSLYEEAKKIAAEKGIEPEKWLSDCIEAALTRVVNMRKEEYEAFVEEYSQEHPGWEINGK